MTVKKTGLGRGLSALMGDVSKQVPMSNTAQAQEKNVLLLDALLPGNFQPRRFFAEEDLQDLAESVQKNGVILPIIVRPSSQNGMFEIIAGERRWRASKIAGLSTIPAIIRHLTDKEALEFALIENIQRQDLTPLEEADGYTRLIEDFAYTQEDIASRLGKSRSHVANLLRLLTLPAPVKDLLHAKSLSMGHARALVNVDNAAEIALKIVKEGLSVRQVEKLVHKKNGTTARKNLPPKIGQPELQEESDETLKIAQALTHSLGMPVTIEEHNNTGSVSIAFSGLMQLDKILQLLGGRI